MTQEYTLSSMIDSVSKYFANKGFTVEQYSKRLYNIRLPLYCFKSIHDNGDNKVKEQIVVDMITGTHISKDKYLPDKLFNEFDEYIVKNASSVKFFQYYLPEAKIFWAYGDYVPKDNKFERFKKSCQENGIGLLEVSDGGEVTKVLKPLSLKEILRKRVAIKLSKIKKKDTNIVNAMSNIIYQQQREYIQYLVFYGEPQFLRRGITDRKDDLSLFLNLLLINSLEGVRNVAYREHLKSFSDNYIYENKNDHDIAFKIINTLWKERLGLEYPDIHKDFEVVLLLDPHYRDHFLHQFQVFILGILIIDALYDETWIKDFEEKHGSKIEDAWLACSTYHDYNYPIQKWDDWMKNFLGKNFHVNDTSKKHHLGRKDIEKDIMRLNLGEIIIRDEFFSKMQRLSTGIDCECNDNFQRFVIQRSAVDKNHAALGALTFLEIFQSKNMLSDTAIGLAAASILLHDEPNWQCLRGDKIALLECTHRKKNSLSIDEKDMCHRPGLTILTPDSAPLAFLHAYCDVAQEWGRKGRDFGIAQPGLRHLRRRLP